MAIINFGKIQLKSPQLHKNLLLTELNQYKFHSLVFVLITKITIINRNFVGIDAFKLYRIVVFF